MNKLCPTCGQLHGDAVARCDCGHRFAVRESAPPVSEFADKLPNSAWWRLATCIPITWAVLLILSLFRSGPLSDSFWLVGVAFLALPTLAQFTASGRRQGGCMFGCLAWIAVMVALGVGASFWDYEHDPTQDGVVYHNLLFVPGEAMACDRVELGMTPSEVAQATGQEPEPMDLLQRPQIMAHLQGQGAAPSKFTGVRYGETMVWFRDGKATRVEGSNLSQRGKVLLRRGDPRVRLEHLFRNQFSLQKTTSGTVLVPLSLGRAMTVIIADKPEHALAMPPGTSPTADAADLAGLLGATRRGRRRH
ncbi:MAG: hypothetical protein AB7S38_20400 [Vulcanimicrobiota bacterium]